MRTTGIGRLSKQARFSVGSKSVRLTDRPQGSATHPATAATRRSSKPRSPVKFDRIRRREAFIREDQATPGGLVGVSLELPTEAEGR